MKERQRPYCNKINSNCIGTKCEHFQSRRPMTKYEKTCVLCFDVMALDPYVYDWCPIQNRRMPLLEVEVFKEDI